MDRRELLGIMGLAVFADFHAEAAGSSPPAMEQATGTTTPASVREPFVGIYRLAVYPPHGDNPIGRIQYDRGGRMWAMLHPPGRTPLPSNPTAADYQAMQRGLVAYFGSFDVDEATRRVIHHVEAASDPRWIGTDFVRWYRFEGNRLILSLNADFTSTLTWERLPEG